MQYTLSFALLSALAVASPIVKRSDTTAAADPIIITGVLANLNGGITKTYKDITAWKGDGAGVNGLLQDASYLLADIRKGATTVATSPAVTIWDKPDWLRPVIDLDNNLDKLVNTLVSKKSKFDSVGRTTDVLSQIEQIKPAVDVLVKNIFAKLPAAAQLVARPVSNQVIGKIEKARKAYAPRSGSLGSRPGPPPSPQSVQPAWNAAAPAPQSPWGAQQQQGPPPASTGGWGSVN